MALVQGSSVFMPLTFGALGTSLGLTPVFIAVGASLAVGAWFWRRR